MRKINNSNMYNENIQEAFEQIVDIFPNRIALIDGDRTLTYQELNYQVNEMANFLNSRRKRLYLEYW